MHAKFLPFSQNSSFYYNTICAVGCPCRRSGWTWRKVLRWGRHQMETFSVLLAICVGNSPVTGEVPAQRPVTQSFDVFFDLRQNKRLSKQWWGWWFETLLHPLWRHCHWVWCNYSGFHTKNILSYITRSIAFCLKRGVLLDSKISNFSWKRGVFFIQNPRKGCVFQSWMRA